MSYFREEIEKLANDTLLSNTDIARVVGCSPRTVHRYAGSHSDRCREKDLCNSENLFKIQKTVLLPDIHYPHYEQRVMDAVDEFIIDYDPDELVYMGDQISLDCISSWLKRKPLLKEGQRLLKDYEGFDYHILQTHENITRPDTRRTFMVGNHEYRAEWFCEEHPELKGIVDVEYNLKLKERGYKVIPFNKVHFIGKLSVIHGFYWNKYHTAKTLDVFESSVVYAHVHNPQMFTKVSPIDMTKGYHMATCLGCLCNIAPEYKRGMPSTWANGFGIVEHLPATGYFNLYPITIINGSFMFNGKMYGKDL